MDGSGSNGWPNKITENIEGIFEVDPDPMVTTERFGSGAVSDAQAGRFERGRPRQGA